MTVWDVTLLNQDAGSGSGVFAASGTFTASGTGVDYVPVYSATWDVSLRTQTWTYYNVSGVAYSTTTGFILVESEVEGYYLNVNNQPGWSIRTASGDTYYELQSAEQLGYTLQE